MRFPKNIRVPFDGSAVVPDEIGVAQLCVHHEREDNACPEQATPGGTWAHASAHRPHGNGRSAFTALSSADSRAQSRRNGYRPKCLDRSLKASQKHTARGVQAWTLWVAHLFSHLFFTVNRPSVL